MAPERVVAVVSDPARTRMNALEPSCSKDIFYMHVPDKMGFRLVSKR